METLEMHRRWRADELRKYVIDAVARAGAVRVTARHHKDRPTLRAVLAWLGREYPDPAGLTSFGEQPDGEPLVVWVWDPARVTLRPHKTSVPGYEVDLPDGR